MAEKQTRATPDGCPSCGGEFVVDEKQRPETLVDRKIRNASVPAAAARYADTVKQKAAELGVIHRCTSCGYRSRHHAGKRAA